MKRKKKIARRHDYWISVLPLLSIHEALQLASTCKTFWDVILRSSKTNNAVREFWARAIQKVVFTIAPVLADTLSCKYVGRGPISEASHGMFRVFDEDYMTNLLTKCAKEQGPKPLEYAVSHWRRRICDLNPDHRLPGLESTLVNALLLQKNNALKDWQQSPLHLLWHVRKGRVENGNGVNPGIIDLNDMQLEKPGGKANICKFNRKVREALQPIFEHFRDPINGSVYLGIDAGQIDLEYEV